jgi:hypothetical protein
MCMSTLMTDVHVYVDTFWLRGLSTFGIFYIYTVSNTMFYAEIKPKTTKNKGKTKLVHSSHPVPPPSTNHPEIQPPRQVSAYNIIRHCCPIIKIDCQASNHLHKAAHTHRPHHCWPPPAAYQLPLPARKQSRISRRQPFLRFKILNCQRSYQQRQQPKTHNPAGIKTFDLNAV